MSGRAPRAAECLSRELEARNLPIPEALRRELVAACRAPFTGEPDLYERLMLGCAVLDERGGTDAPDALWHRWEAIFAAWCCCGAEVAARAAIGRRKRRQPIADWSDGTRQTEPRLTGLGKRKSENGAR